VDDRPHPCDRLDNHFAGSEIATHPLDGRILTRLACEHAHLMATSYQLGDDRATEMAGSSSHDDSHVACLFLIIDARRSRLRPNSSSTYSQRRADAVEDPLRRMAFRRSPTSVRVAFTDEPRGGASLKE